MLFKGTNSKFQYSSFDDVLREKKIICNSVIVRIIA